MIATSGKLSYKICVKSTTRKEKLTTKNEDRNVTNANCNSLYMFETMIISVSDNKRQLLTPLALLCEGGHGNKVDCPNAFGVIMNYFR